MIDSDEFRLRISKMIDEYSSMGSMGEVYVLYRVLDLISECYVDDMEELHVCMRKVQQRNA